MPCVGIFCGGHLRRLACRVSGTGIFCAPPRFCQTGMRRRCPLNIRVDRQVGRGGRHLPLILTLIYLIYINISDL